MQPIRPTAAPTVPVPGAVAPRPAGPAPAPAPESAHAASFWDSLSPEEQAFFEQIGGLGRLTYGPGSRTPAAPPAPTGRRIDVRA